MVILLNKKTRKFVKFYKSTMPTFGECTLMQEITKTEDAIKSCHLRILALEKRLESIENDDLYRELQEVRKLLNTNEELLHTLHKHNRGSFVFGVAAALIIFIIWMIYILINGNEF